MTVEFPCPASAGLTKGQETPTVFPTLKIQILHSSDTNQDGVWHTIEEFPDPFKKAEKLYNNYERDVRVLCGEQEIAYYGLAKERENVPS